MAATPPSLTTPPPPPPPQADQLHQSFLSHQDYSEIFSFMPQTMPNGAQDPTASFGIDGATPALHPPAPPAQTTANGHTDGHQQREAQDGDSSDQQHASRPEHHDGSSGDEDEEDSDDDGGEAGEMDRSWYSIFEEKRDPVEDELRYWKESTEHSAEDHAYWEGKTFTNLEDPELQPGESGRIDFAVDGFNGTREKPNKETVMRSQPVEVGGCEWRLKFYPKGNNTDHLSVYIENVTMQADDWTATEEFTNPPLPFIGGRERPRKRRCVAAQVCVVLFNPSEPRQYEHRVDAHQFTKDSPDYGWTRFTHMRRRDLGLRNHFQRAPLLQDDKLAFKAYIRVINDPTGCLWDHSSSKYSSIVAATGLRPFSSMLPILAADVVLLHFPPFRQLVYKWKREEDCSQFVSWMSILLWKMLTRERSEEYGIPIGCEQSDAIAWLQRAAKYMAVEEGTEAAQSILGTLDPANGAAVGPRRLQTQSLPSIQAALDAHSSALETPALLTLELDRQRFDGTKREWKRITNKVEIEDKITVGNARYTLFAFVTHCGELSSNEFKTYVRPHGPNTMWYGYSNGNVTCMTNKQALEKRCGRDESEIDKRERTLFSFTRDRRGMQIYRDDLEVAHAVFYVREDHAPATFSPASEVDWKLPRRAHDESTQQDTASVSNGSTIVAKELAQDSAPNRTSISSAGSDYLLAGCATPTHWFMDEDGDVVMSDQEDDGANDSKGDDQTLQPTVPEAELVNRTIDNLGCSYYSGHMLGSRYHGQGHLITLNGDEYIGTFAEGRKHGAGKMTYASNGDVYEGGWENGERHGSGKYTEASTGNVFDGTWKHDKKSGKFTLTGTVTEEDKGICGICYEREINTAFYDCGHAVACNSCSHQIEDCPICRRRIVSRLQLFGVKISLE